MKPIKDYILIQTDQTHLDSMGDFYLDPLYNPTANIKTWAEVKATPVGASKKFQNDLSKIEEGDTVYFNYKMFDDDDFGLEFKAAFDEYICPMRWLFAVKKKSGEILMMDDWTLAEYVYPEDSMEIEVDGKKMRVRTGSLIISEIDIKPILNRVKVLRDPMKELNDKVVFHADSADWPYEIDGEEKLIVRREWIYGVFD
jgi:co-chaperonin GroES (HSP10)